MGKSTCTVDGCERSKIMARGLCSPHYKRWYRYGDPLAGQAFRDPKPELCSVDGCGRQAKTRLWCGKHYMRLLRHGDPEGGRDRNPSPSDCAVAGCPHAPYVRGWCARHHSRWRRYGDPLGAAEPSPDRPCVVGGCADIVDALGYCNKHYKRWRRNGVAERSCPSCGDDLGDVRGTFCSDECVPGWIEGDAQVRRSRGKISRHVAIPTLLGRDGDMCSLCTEPLDLGIAWPDLMSVSIDHVHPVSLGGTNDIDNLALAHFGCNVRKSNRPV